MSVERERARWGRIVSIMIATALACGLVSALPAEQAAADPLPECGTAAAYRDGFEQTCIYDLSPAPSDNGNAGNADAHLLDVYWPDVPATELATLPIVFWIHGGGLVAGSKDGFHNEAVANHFLDTGHVVVSINYTLRDNSCGDDALACNPIDPDDTDGDTFEAELQWLRDAANAFKWVWDNVAGAGIGDPARITVAGHSAGAYISLMLATERDHLAEAFGIDPADSDVRAAIAGVMPLGIAANLNTVDDTSPWPLERQDFVINSANINDLFESLYDIDADLAPQGRPGTKMWEWGSAIWQAIDKPAPQIPPLLMASGGGDCSATPGDPHWCRTTNWDGDFPDPPAFAATLRDFTTWARGEGVHASYIQPLISAVDTDSRRCWANVAHANLVDLFAPEAARLNWDMAYYEEAAGVCEVLASLHARVVNDAFIATIDSFVDTQIAQNPQPIVWQPSTLEADIETFSAASLPDTDSDALTLNIGGGSLPSAWSAARPITDLPPPRAATAGGHEEARVGAGRRTLIGNDVNTNGVAPEALFKMQARADGDDLVVSAPAPNATYEVSGLVADTIACRAADVYFEGAAAPAATNVALSGPAPYSADRVALGVATVTDGDLDVALDTAAGSCAPPMLAGLELVEITPPETSWAVDASLGGGIRYANSSAPISADFRRAEDELGLRSFSGTARLPGVNGGTAYVSTTVSRFAIFSFFLGQVRIVDQGAGVNTSTPVFGNISSAGPTTTLRGRWFTVVPPFSIRPYSARLAVTEL